ncbi:hypothetical protein CALVIDRAFT_595384 [Calocera viscosa TUFC12733]|uniref:LsmAD domain-containing protein n=1 Tax=Calocera viscosa (strain TUFC12733) TaxID=1330018 RepID=A0A167R6E9_CALVF|nr:hypothetical protein CALVIDRAFT_595384 [Calocera viscosa TUFC12733]
MAAPRGGGNKRKDGDMGRGGGSRGRGAWGRGAPHMNQPYTPNMAPNMTPTGMHSPRSIPSGLNGHPSFSNIAQSGMPPPSAMGMGNGAGTAGLSANIGAKVVVSLSNGQRFEGILSDARLDNQFLLTDAKEPNGNMRAKLQVMSHQLMSWNIIEPAPAKPAASSDLAVSAEATGDAGFRTDGDIASTTAAFRERDLVGPGAWANDTSAGLPPLPNFNDGHASGDDVTFGLPSAGGWDQFAANEKLFGVTTSFDEELYTTKLDRSASDFREKEKRAQKLADEIQHSLASNVHIAEERGAKVDDSGVNEEDKYSGVARNPNVYVPPAARRAAAAAAANGSPLSVGKALSPQPAPAALASKPSSPTVPTAGTGLATLASPSVPVSAPSASVVLSVAPNVHGTVTEGVDKPAAAKDEPMTAVKLEAKADSAPPTEKADTKPAVSASAGASPATSSGASDKQGATPAKVPQVTVENPLVQDFRNFVHAEKERLTTQRKNLAKSEKDKRIADLIRFSSSFKLNKEVPEDLVNIMTKDEEKKRTILEKSKQDARANGARAIGPAPSMNTSASTRYGLGVAQAANAVKSPAANAIPPSSSASAAPSTGSKPVKLAEKYAISDIPPFNPGKAKVAVVIKHGPNSGTATPGKATPAAGSTPSTSPSNDFKLNINASSFRPNVNAPSFKPINGASPSPAPSGSPVRPPLSKKPTDEPAAPSQPNPFFGSTPLKKGSVHIKDDFSPFKHNKIAEASSTPSTWPFSGKRYASLLPPQPTPPPPQQMPAPFEDENQQAQMAQAQAYMTQMYAGYRYGYPGPPQPGQPPMPMPGHPNGYMPPPQFMPIYGPMPGVPGGGPPAMYAHPMMSPMGPPGAQYMQSPVQAPSPYPGAPNGAGAGRGSMPPTPLPPHAYAHYPNPQMPQGMPYQMMMPPGPPNGPPMSFEAQGPPMSMGPPH